MMLEIINGVCIGVNRNKLIRLLQTGKPEYCDTGFLAPVYYTPQQQVVALDFLCKTALDTFDSLKDDEDQTQKIIPKIQTGYSIQLGDYVGEPRLIEMNLKKSFVASTLSYIESVEKTAPFLKHQFWEEENEYRAAFNLRSPKKPHDDFIDITITEDLIDYIILGPTFSVKEVDAISKMKEVTLNFDLMDKKQSRGTGIIHMN